MSFHDIKHCILKFRDFSVDLRNQVLYLLQQKGHTVYSVTLQSTVSSQSSERRAMECCVAFAQCNTAVTRPSLKNSQKEAKQCCPPSTSKPSNADFYPKCKFCPIQFLPQNDIWTLGTNLQQAYDVFIRLSELGVLPRTDTSKIHFLFFTKLCEILVVKNFILVNVTEHNIR